jgi:hypothetical protein
MKAGAAGLPLSESKMPDHSDRSSCFGVMAVFDPRVAQWPELRPVRGLFVVRG